MFAHRVDGVTTLKAIDTPPRSCLLRAGCESDPRAGEDCRKSSLPAAWRRSADTPPYPPEACVCELCARRTGVEPQAFAQDVYLLSTASSCFCVIFPSLGTFGWWTWQSLY